MEELQFPGKSPSRVPNNFRFDSGSVEATGGPKSDKIELTGIGIFGGEADSEADSKAYLDQVEDSGEEADPKAKRRTHPMKNRADAEALPKF